jgi:formylglycine-generating enzyme required for sulfatase activity
LQKFAMTQRRFLIASVGGGALLASAMIGAFATIIVRRDTARSELTTCAAYSGLPAEDGDTTGMGFIPAGTFVMGSERHQPEERFTHLVRIDGFWIDRHEVSNAQFEKFVRATGYVTLAERGLDPKAHPDMAKDLLVPGSVVFIQPTDVTSGGRIAQWWQYVPGAGHGHRPFACGRVAAPGNRSADQIRVLQIEPVSTVGIDNPLRQRRGTDAYRAEANDWRRVRAQHA